MWEVDACVLADLTKQVLAIDQMQSSTKQGDRWFACFVEVLYLLLSHHADYVLIGMTIDGDKTLVDTVTGTRPGHNKIILIEVDQVAVVDIDCVLKSQERTH